MKIFFYNSKPKIDFFFQNSVQFRRRARNGRGGNLGLSESVDPSGFEPLISSLQMRRSTTELRAHDCNRESSINNRGKCSVLPLNYGPTKIIKDSRFIINILNRNK